MTKSEIKEQSVDANIVVKDGISGAVLTPNSNGEYLLCEGDYLISATAEGYRDAGQKLELSQATESKIITVPMVSVTDLTKAHIAIKFKDNQGNDIMESVTETGDFYVGDKYTVRLITVKTKLLNVTVRCTHISITPKNRYILQINLRRIAYLLLYMMYAANMISMLILKIILLMTVY